MTAPAVEDLSQQEPGPLEGTGIFQTWAEFGETLQSGDGLKIGIDTVATGLDTLGLIADPLGTLSAAGVGFLIEHIAFLREPLDALAGDPLHIKSLAESWNQVRIELQAVSLEVAEAAEPTGAKTPPWEGAAATAYREAAAHRAESLAVAATQVDGLAQVLLNGGAMVGIVRGLIRDIIAEWVGGLIGKALTALFGGPGAIPFLISETVADAIALAGRIGRRIDDLLRRLSDAGGLAGRLADATRAAADLARTGARATYQGARVVEDLKERYPVLDEGSGIVLDAADQPSTDDLEEPN